MCTAGVIHWTCWIESSLSSWRWTFKEASFTAQLYPSPSHPPLYFTKSPVLQVKFVLPGTRVLSGSGSDKGWEVVRLENLSRFGIQGPVYEFIKKVFRMRTHANWDGSKCWVHAQHCANNKGRTSLYPVEFCGNTLLTVVCKCMTRSRQTYLNFSGRTDQGFMVCHFHPCLLLLPCICCLLAQLCLHKRI